MTESFVDNSEKTERLCSVCNITKPVSEFYKDGTDRDGNTKYRRDCKLCYRATRIKTKRGAKRNGNVVKKGIR